MYKIIVFIGALLLSGCATVIQSEFTQKTILENKLDSNGSVLFGSFSRNGLGMHFGNQSFFFKNVETQKEYIISSQHEFNMFAERTRDDFSDTTSKGAVYAFHLPAGKYTFHKFYLSYSKGSGHVSRWSNEPYSIPFVVKKNKINYVGEIKILPNVGKDLLGMKVLDGGVWHVSNELDRDLEIYRKKFPDLSQDSVSSVLPEDYEVYTNLIVLPESNK